MRKLAAFSHSSSSCLPELFGALTLSVAVIIQSLKSALKAWLKNKGGTV